MPKPTTSHKLDFEKALKEAVSDLKSYAVDESGCWTVKGFIDVYKNIYTISADTKVVSKILEIHLFPELLKFCDKNGYKLVPAGHQNHYPDLSFVSKGDESIRFALDLKTTYRKPENPQYCNGFTLGSHGEYFLKRDSTKNITFPYNTYAAHYALGVIYSRAADRGIDETEITSLDKLESIVSVAKDFDFFVQEKWRIASDKSGSGNTANIGSIKCIDDIVAGRGVFMKLGEEVFDDYWMNYGKIHVIDEESGKTHAVTSLSAYLKYKGIDENLAVKKTRMSRRRMVKANES